jgi:hypothetical protein
MRPLCLTEIFRLVRDTEHVLHALLYPAHSAPLHPAESTPGRRPSRSFAGWLLLAVILGILLVVAITTSGRSILDRFNFGFGPEMECSHPGGGDAVCIRKPAFPQ